MIEGSEIKDVVAEFTKQHANRLHGHMLSCAELSLLFLTYADLCNIRSSLIYMVNTQAAPTEVELEDHVAPVLKGVIIDFAFTIQGVARVYRRRNTLPPEFTKLPERWEKYGAMGYGKFIFLSMSDGIAFLKSLDPEKSKIRFSAP